MGCYSNSLAKLRYSQVIPLAQATHNRFDGVFFFRGTKFCLHRDADSMIAIASPMSIPGAQAARDAQGSDATLEDQVLVLQMLWSERSRGLERILSLSISTDCI